MSDALAIRPAAAEDLERIRALWDALYRHQEEHGMLLRLPADAFDHWMRGIAPYLGRFAAVFIAERGSAAVGFAAARVRTMPPQFGTSAVGTVSELYVSHEERGGGVGERLLDAPVQWLRGQGITRIEVQVVSANPEALRFYQRLGWIPEFTQLVWQAPQDG